MCAIIANVNALNMILDKIAILFTCIMFTKQFSTCLRMYAVYV